MHPHFFEPFALINPDVHTIPAVVSLPHSGMRLTEQMEKDLLPGTVLPNMDWYLPKLYIFLEEMGFTLLINNMSRYVIDPNRSREETCGPSYQTCLVYTHTTQGQEMYRTQPDAAEIARRTEECYLPYHAALSAALSEKRRRFDTVYLFDLHSFGLPYGADVILGDRFGASCAPAFTCFLGGLFAQNGFTVKENEPFSGGYITRHYGAQRGIYAVQIELWYRAYIEQREFGNEMFPAVDAALFDSAQKRLKNVFSAVKETLLQSVKGRQMVCRSIFRL